jgi:hypothetical protein
MRQAGRVRLDDDALEIEDEEGVGRRLEDAAVGGLAGAEGLLGADLLADVAARAEEDGGLLRARRRRGPDGVERHLVTVDVAEAADQVAPPVVALEPRPQRRAVRLDDEVGDREPDDLLRPVAEQVLDGGAGVEDPAEGVHLPDPVAADLRRPLEPAPRPLEAQGPEPVLGDLPDQADEPLDLDQPRERGLVRAVAVRRVVEREHPDDRSLPVAHEDHQAIGGPPGASLDHTRHERGRGTRPLALGQEADRRVAPGVPDDLAPSLLAPLRLRAEEAPVEALLHPLLAAAGAVGRLVSEIEGDEGRLPLAQRHDGLTGEVEEVLEIVESLDLGQGMEQAARHANPVTRSTCPIGWTPGVPERNPPPGRAAGSTRRR